MRVVLFTSILTLISRINAVVVPFYSVSITSDSLFDWNQITPSRNLQYHPCYDGFQCARLEVPMDWQNPSAPETVAIAIIKLPARIDDPSDPRFGGTIITNPGGPGGSGIQFLLQGGARYIQSIVDSDDDDNDDDNRYYEILSFDPRGVWQTTPRLDCFRGDSYSRRLWDFEKNRMGMLDPDDGKIGQRLAMARAFGSFCRQAYGDGDKGGGVNINEHITTAAVARDMLEIVDQLEIERRNNILARTTEQRRQQQRIGVPLFQTKNNAAKLQYWGFSYGTHLGNTFASMFPDRVARMVLDGVVDSYDYSTTVRQLNPQIDTIRILLTSLPQHGLADKKAWSKNLQDAEPVINHFYETCYNAGTPCPLFNKTTDKSSADIKAKVDKLFNDLIQSPVPVVQGKNLTMFTRTDLQEIYFLPFYFPVKYFPKLAETLADLVNGDPSLIRPPSPPPPPGQHDHDRPGEKEKEEEENEYWTYPEDIAIGIMCTDGPDLTNQTAPELQSYLQTLLTQSPSLARKWATWRIQCAGWPYRGKWRYTGPFETPNPGPGPAPSGGQRQGGEGGRRGPDVPLLFLSSRFDPVTPLRNAVAMARGHPGSVVVSQNSYGHSSVFAAPSNCTAGIVRKYFGSGVLPSFGKGEGSGIIECDAECLNPWFACPNYRKP